MKTIIIWGLLLLSLVGTIVFLLSQVSDIQNPFSKEVESDVATSTTPMTFDQAVVYTCAGERVVATAFKTGDTSTLELSLPNNNPMLLTRTDSVSGSRYVSPDGIVFLENNGSVLVEKDGAVIFADCKVRMTEPEGPLSSATSTSELSGTKWVWNETSYATGTAVTPNEPDDFVLTFSENGRFSANTDCNNVGGAYVGGVDGSVSFTEIVSTLMACIGDTKEADFVNMLADVVSYRIDSTQLILSLKSDAENGEMKLTRE
jgi:heat shock protein HslJ